MITKFKIIEIAPHESIAFRMTVLVSTLDVGLSKIIVCVKVESLIDRNLWCILLYYSGRSFFHLQEKENIR